MLSGIYIFKIKDEDVLTTCQRLLPVTCFLTYFRASKYIDFGEIKSEDILRNYF